MTMIVLENFDGIAPGVAPRRLSNTAGVKADNIRFNRGRLDAFKDINNVQSVPVNTASIYYYQAAWITSTYPRRYVGVIQPHDVLEKIYFTDSDYPKIKSGASEYRLGVPAPGPVSGLPSDMTGLDPSEQESRHYIVTFVDAWGREGPPSDPAGPLVWDSETDCYITLPVVPTGNYNLGTGALLRLYRSNTGTSASAFQFVKDYPIANAGSQILDDVPSANLQEVIPSSEWIGPPDDDTNLYPDGPLQGLVELPNGVLAGFSGNSVYFSEPYLPHAWPYSYRKSTSDNIVAIAPVPGGLAVLTDRVPYIVNGALPASMIIMPSEIYQACVSAEGVVNMGGYILYPSPDGLVQLNASGGQIVSQGYYDRDAWAAIQPETFRAMRYEESYFAFYGDIDDGTGLVYVPGAQGKAFSTLSGLKVKTGYHDALTDVLNLVYKDGGGNWQLGEFDRGGGTLPMTWISKPFRLQKAVGFRAVTVKADSYPVTLTLTADGVERLTIAIADDTPRVIPGGYRALEWQIKIEGTTGVDYVGLFEAMSEAL